MEIYSENDKYLLLKGDMRDLNKALRKCSVDAVITDPHYELAFMNKSWDASGVAFQADTWKHCFDVLKPGGYLLAFGGSRTFHRIACAIEDAGFEIRDTIMWIYGSGFPKSMNIGMAIDKKNGVESEVIGYAGTMPDFLDVGKKQKEISGVNKLTFGQVENSERKEAPIYRACNEWDGWGTALKPAYEPIIVARKPCEGGCVDNVLKYRVGGINIDECRVGEKGGTKKLDTSGPGKSKNCYGDGLNVSRGVPIGLGRFPANVILTYDDTDREEVCGGFPDTRSSGGTGEISIASALAGPVYNGGWSHSKASVHQGGLGDYGSAARYFYCAKASSRDRDEGCGSLSDGILNRTRPDKDRPTGLNTDPKFAPVVRKNTHPTVKPTALMSYLVRLVAPRGATILDPFMGSGSTGKAVMYENKDRDADYKFIGVELTEEYLPIAEARIRFVLDHGIELEEEESYEELSLLDWLEEEEK